jgi:hypothetical protein
MNAKRNLEWDMGSCFPGLKLKDLIMDVYEKANIRKIWWLVRHSAGMLGMKSDQLAKVLLFFCSTRAIVCFLF